MSLGKAHEIASGLELAIETELGPGVEVETHLEPLEVDELSGQDADATTTGQIEAALVEAAREGGVIAEVHNLRVRQTASGLIVNYHCRAAPELSVNDVHSAVDRLDRQVRLIQPHLTRVVGHAEPHKP